MRRKKNILTLLQTKTLMNITSLNLSKILVEHLCHRRTCNISSFTWKTTLCKIATCMLWICKVHIWDNIYDATVGLFWEAFVLTTITCLHVEDRDVKTLSTNNTQTTVCITQNENCIRPSSYHKHIWCIYNVTASSTKVITYSIHINLRILQIEILKKNTIKVIVIILAGVSQNNIKISTCLVDDGCETDNLWACTYNYQQF